MCDVCRVFKPEHSFDCPQVTEWPDHPWDKETRIEEAHATARFRRENPDKTKPMDRVAETIEKCDHDDNHKWVQDWQGVLVLVKTCNHCGATRNLFQDYE
jgi:hypothetical protein